MQMEKLEKPIGSRHRCFVVWSRADALAQKTGKPFDEVLPTAMSGMKLSGTDLRGVLDLQKVNQDIRETVLGAPLEVESAPVVESAPTVESPPESPSEPEPANVVAAAPADDVFSIFDALGDEPTALDEDVSTEDVDPEAKLVAARERVVAYLNKVQRLPCHAIPFPKLGVTFFIVGKITIDGDHREWNHNGKHGKFKALIPDCETKIIPLNGETFPKPFFFEDWAWQTSPKEPKTFCSGSLKVFCLKHELGAEYICWVNPGGKGDPWRFKYKMTATGLELTRFKLKPDSKEDYVRLDVQPVVIGPIA